MKTYTFAALIEPGDIGEWVVSFPDVPEAVTQAETVEEARLAAQDALGLALLSYPMRGRPLPTRRHAAARAPASPSVDADITVAPDVTAKLAVLEAFQASGRSEQDLAAELARDPASVSRILDPMDPTDIQTLALALEALGQRLIVGVAAIGEAA